MLEAGRPLNVYGSGHIGTKKPIWNPTEHPLKGKTILLVLEGGQGDEVIQVRFAKTFVEEGHANVIVAADQHLHCLFQRIPYIKKLITREEIPDVEFDYWVPGFSAVWLLGYDFKSLPNTTDTPYLTANPASIEVWKNLIKSDKIKVGIRWSGNPKFEHQQFRKFPVEPLFDLADYKEVQLYSLQRDTDVVELPSNIIDLQHLMISWEDTAAAIENMDLIITSCTSIAHVSAAMGKPTWVITPILPYHTWTYGDETSPWYKTVRVFRQQKFARWGATFNNLHDELIKYIEDKQKVNITKYKHKDYVLEEKTMNAPAVIVSSGLTTAKKNFIFVAGLPNSGGDLIIDTLRQNLSVYGDQTSSLYNIFNQLFYQIDPSVSTLKKANILRAMVEGYYADIEQQTVIDNNVLWVTKLNCLEEILGQPIKVICPVRNPAEILSVFELDRRKNPMRLTQAETSLGDNSSIAARCYYYAKPEGALGIAHSVLKDALVEGYQEKMLFVDYHKFCNSPKQQIKRIAEFLNLESFAYNMSHIKKQELNTIEVVGLDLSQQYNAQVFWNALI